MAAFLLLADNRAFGQLTLTPAIVNPSCIKTMGHNFLGVGNGSIVIVPSGGTAPYTFFIFSPGYLNVTQENGYFPNLKAGDFTITVTDSKGVNATYHVTLTNSNPAPVISDMHILTQPTTCSSADASMIIQASGGSSPLEYSIDGGFTFSSSAVFTGLRPGFYQGIVKDANGCLAEFTPAKGPYPIKDCGIFSGISQTTVTACSDDALVLSEAAHSTFPYHDTDPWKFSYDGINYHRTNVGTSGDTVNHVGPGLHEIYVKDTVTGQSEISGYAVIKSCLIYFSFVGVDASCGGSDGRVTVTASNGNQPYQYTIDGIHYQLSNVFTGLAAGNYSIGVMDANGQTNSTTVTVTIVDAAGPQGSASFTPASCQNTNGVITVDATGGTAPLQYSIDNGNTFQAGNVFNGLDSGKYLVVAKDANGCSAINPVTLTALSTTVFSLGNDTALCKGQTLVLSGPAGGGYQYQWQDNSVGSSFTVSEPGVYTLQLTNQDGCESGSTVKIGQALAPVVQLGKDTTLCISEQLVLNASETPGVASPGASYTWQDGSTGPDYAVSKAGGYSVDVVNQCGEAKDSIEVAYDNCTCKFYMPNAFTPNKDGKNDFFMPKYICLLSHYELRVFNRLGQLLFLSRDPAVGWGGDYGAHVQPPGVYVWQLSYRDDRAGKTVQKNGTVVLIR